MDRKSLITFFAIYAVVAGIGYTAWADHDRGTRVELPESASTGVEDRAPDEPALRSSRLGGRAKRLAGARHVRTMQESVAVDFEGYR